MQKPSAPPINPSNRRDFYLTKIWIGNKWWYIDTDRKWKHRNFHLRRFKLGWVSYKKIKEF